MPPTVLAVVGLQREAKIVARAGTRVVTGGGRSNLLAETIERAIDSETRGIVSVGIAGALAPNLEIGECLAASGVTAGSARLAVDAMWTDAIRAKLAGVRTGIFVGSDEIATEATARAALQRIGDAVDMESHVAARAAMAHGLPFAALRVISDRPDQVLPPAALVAMRPDGSIDLRAVMRSVLSQPSQIPALIRTARDSEIAFRALLRSLDLLGVGLACPYLGELALDVR